MFYSNEFTRTLLIPIEVTSSDFLAELLSPSARRPPLYDRLYYHLAARGIMKRENGSDSKVKKAGT